MTHDAEFLTMAIMGYEETIRHLGTRRDVLKGELRKMLRGAKPQVLGADAKNTRKRTMSAEGRARIAAAQKRRWAAARKQKAESAA